MTAMTRGRLFFYRSESAAAENRRIAQAVIRLHPSDGQEHMIGGPRGADGGRGCPKRPSANPLRVSIQRKTSGVLGSPRTGRAVLAPRRRRPQPSWRGSYSSVRGGGGHKMPDSVHQIRERGHGASRSKRNSPAVLGERSRSRRACAFVLAPGESSKLSRADASSGTKMPVVCLR